MATKFEDIYDLFIAQIDDYELFSVSEEELKEVVQDYLLNGLIHLVEGPEYLYEVDVENKSFSTDLSYPEKLLVAKCMTLEWINTKRNSAELMRKDIGDRDYKAVQGTAYLKQLSTSCNSLRAEIRQNLIRYSYRNSVIEGLTG